MFLALFICSKQGERWMMGGLLASVQDAFNAICTYFSRCTEGLRSSAAGSRGTEQQGTALGLSASGQDFSCLLGCCLQYLPA